MGYLRVSTDKQADEGYGLDIQEKNVIAHSRNLGLTNLVLFIDDSYTGTKMERPALDGIKAMINEFNDGNSTLRVNAMVVNKMDRLGRTLEATWPYMTDKEKHSVCQELIDRIVIHKDGVIDVHLKLRSYLINK